jgi:hypothetical protein
LPRLTSHCQWRTVEDGQGTDRHTLALRRKPLIWLLDRLAPKSDGSIFEPFLDHYLGIYAWGRRLPPERRIELVRVPLPACDLGSSRRRLFLQALLIASCDSCPNENLNSLLAGPDCWGPVLEWPDVSWLPSLEEEFYRRSTHAGTRREQLLVYSIET